MSIDHSHTHTCHCPVCGPAPSRPVVASEPVAESLNFSDLKQSWFGFFKKKVFFSYYRCQKCGLLFSPTYFSDDALGRLYGSMPDNTAGLNSSNLERTQEGYFNLLLRHSLPAGDYFELGPDIGLLTQFAAKRMPGAKFWLYEPNVAVHSRLSSSTHGNPHEIRTEMKDFSAVPDGSIAVGVLIHVLDHLPDAVSVMRQFARKLRPDGVVLIITHNERSWLPRIIGSRWPAFCLQHPHLFNRNSMRRFLERCDLEVIETVRTVNYFPVLYLLRHLCFAVGLKFAAKWTGNGPIVPLKLGNIGTIARRRRA